MRDRFVEIAEDGRYLSAKDGFLVVSECGSEVGRVPLDDIAGVIATARGTTFTRAVIDALATRGVTLVVCGSNFAPTACLVPLVGHHAQGERLRAQAEASIPTRKRAWQSIVRAKLAWQGAALAACGAPNAPLTSLTKKVRSGDVGNVEAQGARRYWSLLFGTDFRRDPQAGGTNALLNYGYAVMRSAGARSIAAAGLHPGLGIHHGSHKNPMPLADDLMEPFRPVVDAGVRIGLVGIETGLTPETKRRLVKLLFLDVNTDRGVTPLLTCMQRLASSLAEVFVGEAESVEVPPAPEGAALRGRIIEVFGDGDSDGLPADVDDGDV